MRYFILGLVFGALLALFVAWANPAGAQVGACTYTTIWQGGKLTQCYICYDANGQVVSVQCM